ncbi:hypothetical protein C7212DRAFT_361263 [Tuber magnatum]|uniref:Uncharacterized protein n=1 Tax=Tuber magnatum TaxID=42249 RepID=A0A317T4M8_9PEZI|nr:hypothetical protein C7212DRAFT_361263 [Tuber magnatum]
MDQEGMRKGMGQRSVSNPGSDLLRSRVYLRTIPTPQPRPSLPQPHHPTTTKKSNTYHNPPAKMRRTSASTIKAAKIPKHIIEINMTPEQYFGLKIYIKSIVLPGTPGFEGKRLASKNTYRQWLNHALQEIGPKFFPGGKKGLVWPLDYDRIYGAVNQVIQAMSYQIRKDHKKKMGRLRVAGGEKDNDEMGVVEDGEHCGGGLADTEVDEDITMVDEEFFREQKQEMEAIVTGQNGPDGDATGAEMEAEPIELEDLLDFVKPEVFAEFPDLADEQFDWVGITGSTRPEPAYIPVR